MAIGPAAAEAGCGARAAPALGVKALAAARAFPLPLGGESRAPPSDRHAPQPRRSPLISELGSASF